MIIKVLLADDHILLRQSLALFLATDPEIEVIGQAENGKEAVELSESLNPDLILMDIMMPVLDGVQAAYMIRKKNKKVKIVMLTMVEDEGYIYEALDAEINGYFLKTIESYVFISAIKSIIDGENIFDNKITKILSKRYSDPSIKNDSLSPREKEIIKLVAQGLTSLQIAEKLFLSVFTVQKHRKNIIKKLGFKGTADLIKYAIRLRLI